MTSFHHVLVPVDFSEHAGPAIRQGVAIATACHARLTVLFVASTWIEQETRDDLRVRLYRVVQAEPAAWALADVEMVTGDPAREILAFARSMAVDLIVLGMRRHDIIERLFVPSVGDTVARDAECAVLAVTEAAASRAPVAAALGRVLCAVDLSDSSASTLRLAADLARDAGSVLTVLHAVDPNRRTRPFPLASDEASALRDRLAASAYERLATLVARAAVKRVPTETLVAFGQIPNQIVGAAAATAADVLVIGARPTRVLGHSRLGATVREVLRLAQRPVLLARATAAVHDAPEYSESGELIGV